MTAKPINTPSPIGWERAGVRAIAILLFLLPLAGYAQYGGTGWNVPVSGSGSPGGGGNQAGSTVLSNITQFGVMTTNIVWVAKPPHGNDATAQRNSLTFPAATIGKASLMVLPGDSACVLPGTYFNCTNMAQPNVTWMAFGYNSTLCNTNTTNAFDKGRGVWDDRAIDRSASGITGGLYGFKFIWAGTFPTTNSSGIADFVQSNALGCIVSTNPLTRLTGRNVRLDGAALAPYEQGIAGVYWAHGTNQLSWEEGVFDMIGTNTYVAGTDPDGENVLVASVYSAAYWKNGRGDLAAPVLNGGLYSYYGHDTTASNGTISADMYLDVNTYEGRTYVLGNGNLGFRHWYRGHTISVPTLSLINAGRVYFEDFGKLTATGGGFSAALRTEVWFTGQKISASASFFSVTDTHSIIRAKVLHYDDYLGTITTGFSSSGGGRLEIEGGSMVLTNGRGVFVAADAGAVKLKNVSIDTSASTNSPVWVRTNTFQAIGCDFKNNTGRFAVTTDMNATNMVQLIHTVGSTVITNKTTNAVGPYVSDILLR